MFYTPLNKRDAALRFGDIIRGFSIITPNIHDPNVNRSNGYTINVEHPLCVVMSQCCAIGKTTILLSPLMRITDQKLGAAYIDNEFIKKDFTVINKEIPKRYTVTKKAFDKMPPKEQTEYDSDEMVYAFKEYFIYDQYQEFEQYDAIATEGRRFPTKYYMIDFKNLYKINCNKIQSAKASPLELKYLQLSREARQDLRDKISGFYEYVPLEDKVCDTE